MGKRRKEAEPEPPEFNPELLIGTPEWNRQFQEAAEAFTLKMLNFDAEWKALDTQIETALSPASMAELEAHYSDAQAAVEAALGDMFSLTDAEIVGQQADKLGQNRGRKRSQRKAR